MIYNPRDWYWLVGDVATRVWSSAKLCYVEISDSAYTAWMALGNRATRIGNDVDLLQVHHQQVVPHVMAIGLTVTGPAAVRGTYALQDRTAMTNLAVRLASGLPIPGGGDKVTFADINGAPHAFTKDQFLALSAACENYVHNWHQALADAISGKSASFPSNSVKL